MTKTDIKNSAEAALVSTLDKIDYQEKTKMVAELLFFYSAVQVAGPMYDFVSDVAEDFQETVSNINDMISKAGPVGEVVMGMSPITLLAQGKYAEAGLYLASPGFSTLYQAYKGGKKLFD